MPIHAEAPDEVDLVWRAFLVFQMPI